MNRNNVFFLFLLLSVSFSALPAQQMAISTAGSPFLKNSLVAPLLPANDYMANFSISHGHCQLPLEARFTNVKASWGESRSDGLKIDFDISAGSIVAVGSDTDKWTKKMRSPASFDVVKHPTISFSCRDSYRLGEDWYQLNGELTIKGKSRPASFHARPVFNEGGCNRVVQKYVLDGEVNLKGFGVSEGNVGGSAEMSRTMYMNMVVKADGC